MTIRLSTVTPADKMTAIRRSCARWMAREGRSGVSCAGEFLMAQAASMSTEAFGLLFRVCTMDYRRMNEAAELVALMQRQTDCIVSRWHGYHLLHQGYSGYPLYRGEQYSGRRSLYGARARECQWRDLLQYADDL